MQDFELNLVDIAIDMKKRWWIILISAVLCAVIFAGYTVMCVKPLYRSTVEFLVKPSFNNMQSATIVTEAQLSSYATEIIPTYIEVLDNNHFYRQLSDKLKALNDDTNTENSDNLMCENNYTVGELKGMVAYSTREDTSVFKARVTAPTPTDAYVIAKCVDEVACERIKELYGYEALIASDPPVFNPGRVNNGLSRNIIIGFIFGVVLASALIILFRILSIHINDESDISRSYDLPVLGVIPNFEDALHAKRKNSYGGVKNEDK